MGRSPDRLVTGCLVAAELALLLSAEGRSPLRRPRELRATRPAPNGALAGFALAATGFVETPLAMRVAAATQRRGWGLLPHLGLSGALRTVAAVASLDYGMYVWHGAMHRVPALWRLHLVHHVDRDLDVTTALRIHAAEIAVSVAVRVAQVVVLGVTPRQFALWQRLLACSVLVHHANVQLPTMLERVLGAVVVTPRRHGIHHLARRDAQHGNWSSGLVLWDWLHGTLREGDPSRDVGVPAYPDDAGVPAYPDDADVTPARVLVLPFIPQPDPWCSR